MIRQALPQIGLGTYKITGAECKKTVYTALKLGYRLIDTASVYRNEREVGEAISDFINEHSAADKAAIRASIKVTTKLSPKHQGYKDAYNAFLHSLDELGLGYIVSNLFHPTQSTLRHVESLIFLSFCRM